MTHIQPYKIFRTFSTKKLHETLGPANFNRNENDKKTVKGNILIYKKTHIQDRFCRFSKSKQDTKNLIITSFVLCHHYKFFNDIYQLDKFNGEKYAGFFWFIFNLNEFQRNFTPSLKVTKNFLNQISILAKSPVKAHQKATFFPLTLISTLFESAWFGKKKEQKNVMERDSLCHVRALLLQMNA